MFSLWPFPREEEGGRAADPTGAQGSCGWLSRASGVSKGSKQEAREQQFVWSELEAPGRKWTLAAAKGTP